MNRKAEENENLYGDSNESSEEKSVSLHEQLTNNHNLTITIPKYESNVFLKYDYDELIKRKLEKLNIPCEEGLYEDRITFLKEKSFSEDNYHSGGNKLSGKKQVLLFKQLKNFIKLKVYLNLWQDGSANTFLRSKFIEDQMENINQEKISSDDVYKQLKQDEEELENFSNNKFTRNFDFKSTLDQLKREIYNLTSLLNKKRENFDEKFTFSLDNLKENFNEFDLFSLRLNGICEEDYKILDKTNNFQQNVNEKTYRILYNKMKEFVFDGENKSNEFMKPNKLNKRVIGIVTIIYNS